MQTLSPLNPTQPGEFFPLRRPQDDSEFDITPMIDLVFMMNIYFLVTALGGMAGEIDLPKAQHVSGLDAETAVTITVLSTIDGRSVRVYLADRAEGTPILDPAEQEERIAEYIEQARAAGKKAVLIKAEQRTVLREIGRIARAAGAEWMTLHVAVTEKDVSP